MEVNMDNRGNIRTWSSGVEAVKAQAAVLGAHIRSQMIMKLGLYCLAGLFMLGAALLVVFAPDGREVVTSIVAVALFVVAAGCAGFGAFAIKTPLVSASADQGGAPHGADGNEGRENRRHGETPRV